MASPSPTPALNVNVNLNMLLQMPTPHGKSVLCFQGKNIEEFLVKYECFAEHANLTEEKKCQEVCIYFTRKEKHVLDVLEGYIEGDWRALKQELRSLYTSSTEKKTYQLRDIQQFIAKKRKIMTLVHFNMYCCKFKVISSSF